MSNYKIDFSKAKKELFAKKPVTSIEYSSKDPDIEMDSQEELTYLQVSFREKAKKEAELKKKNTGSEFWSCIIFQDQEQRDEFYRILGVNELDNQYINGKKLINALQMAIKTNAVKAPGKFKCNKDILSISINPD